MNIFYMNQYEKMGLALIYQRLHDKRNHIKINETHYCVIFDEK